MRLTLLLKQKASLLKRAFFSKRLAKSESSLSYKKLPANLLYLLCYIKDEEIEHLKRFSEDLLLAMFTMAKDMDESSRQAASSFSTISGDESILCEKEIFSLQTTIRDLEESKNSEIEKLSSENNWLRDRLEEKLRLSQYRGEVIDGLKREIAKLASEAEIGEGRRLCYEYRIKVLEERLRSLPSQKSDSLSSLEKEH